MALMPICVTVICPLLLCGCMTYATDKPVELDGRRYTEDRATAELCREAEALGTVCNGGNEAERRVLDAERHLYPRGVNSTTKRPHMALSLSGGGQRAASSAIGFMEALESSGILEQVDILSTVSGGSYAGYWYVSKLIGLGAARNTGHASNGADKALEVRHLFDRNYIYCTNRAMLDQSCENPKSGFPPPLEVSADAPYGRHQSHLAKNGYLITKQQGTQIAGTPLSVHVEQGSRLVMHALTIPVSWLANGIFDFRHDVGWLRSSYRTGLGRQYGLNPDAETCFLFGKCSDADKMRAPLELPNALNCFPSPAGSNSALRASVIPFDETDPLHTHQQLNQREFPYLVRNDICDLRWTHLADSMNEARGRDVRIPFWILNTTAMYGGGIKWLRGLSNAVGKDLPFASFSNSLKETVYEFTPLAKGSWSLGYFAHRCARPSNSSPSPLPCNAEADPPDLSGTVQLSGAAVDALPFGGNVMLNVFNFGLGGYVDNPAVAKGVRDFHGVIPFPFYLAHRATHDVNAPSIYLSDGGHSGDNLGIYSALKRRPEVLIVFDAEHEGNQERLAAFESLQRVICRLKIENGWTLEFDKTDGLHGLSKLKSSESPCDRNGPRSRTKLYGLSPRNIGYSVLQQPHPVLTGWICLGDGVEVSHCAKEDRVRLIYAKLSLDDTKLDCHGNRCGKEEQKVAHWVDFHESRSRHCHTVEGYKLPQIGSDVSKCAEQPNGLSCETKYFYQANIADHEVSGCKLGDYPHHSTFDINYSPAQFAAYRSLGSDIGRRVHRCAGSVCVRHP